MQAIVAIDLNDEKTPAVLEQASRHAERLGASLDVLFIDGLPYVDGLIQDPAVSSTLEAEASRLRAAHEEKVRALVAGLPETIRGKAITLYGYEPAEAICERSATYDLLFVATHGRTGFAHLMLGSVAEKVVRKAKVPTLVLRV